MTLDLVAKIAQIILIDVVLSGDNAVVIAMAAHRLPEFQRKRAILWGGGIAILLRVVFTLLMAFLLMVPWVRLIGGMVLVWIACKLLIDEGEHSIAGDDAQKSTFAAIRMIFVADFVMSLDNMLAVAGAGGENYVLLVFGLLVSIAIIMTSSAVIARLMNRYVWIVYVGAAILAYTAGKMMLEDRELAGYFARSHQVSLDRHWDEDFMLTHKEVSAFDCGGDLPDDLKDVVWHQNGQLVFVGQLTVPQRDFLKQCVKTDDDRKAIEDIYETSYHRDVPGWIPDGWKARIEPWFQRRWPAEVWKGVQGRQYYFVAWIWYVFVITFCMTCPWWSRRGRSSGDTDKNQPPKV